MLQTTNCYLLLVIGVELYVVETSILHKPITHVLLLHPVIDLYGLLICYTPQTHQWLAVSRKLYFSYVLVMSCLVIMDHCQSVDVPYVHNCAVVWNLGSACDHLIRVYGHACNPVYVEIVIVLGLQNWWPYNSHSSCEIKKAPFTMRMSLIQGQKSLLGILDLFWFIRQTTILFFWSQPFKWIIAQVRKIIVICIVLKFLFIFRVMVSVK